MTASESVLVLGSERWRVGILPLVGASVAFGQIADDDGWVDFMRPTPPEKRNNVDACSSFALIPWSNRVRDGQMRYEGRTWQLRKNEDATNAIHGTARDYPWKVLSYDASSCELELDSRTMVGVNFPWDFISRITYEVKGTVFTVTTTLENCEDEAFPAGFGHHPYFQRTLAGANDEVRLQIPCSQAYVLHNCLPDGPAVPVTERVDFRRSRPLGDVFIDDNLAGRDADQPIKFLYPRSKTEIHLTADPLFSNVVLYVPQNGKDFFAVEPVTNSNDGFSLYERGVPGSGIFVLEPGESRSASFSLEIVN